MSEETYDEEKYDDEYDEEKYDGEYYEEAYDEEKHGVFGTLKYAENMLSRRLPPRISIEVLSGGFGFTQIIEENQGWKNEETGTRRGRRRENFRLRKKEEPRLRVRRRNEKRSWQSSSDEEYE